jgi:hypothetical protein
MQKCCWLHIHLGLFLSVQCLTFLVHFLVRKWCSLLCQNFCDCLCHLILNVGPGQEVARTRHSNCQLLDSGLLSSPTSDSCSWPSPDSVPSKHGGFPATLLDSFPVTISPRKDMGHVAVDPSCDEVGPNLARFREACRKPISPVLSRPARRCRKKRVYSGPVGRSRRIRGRYTDKTPVRSVP